MSAIAGMVTKKMSRQSKDIVKKMCDIQNHRGPDGEGIILKDNVCFGHRLHNLLKSESTVREPMVNEDSTIMITCDSSIYNSEELKKDLIKRGFQFKSDSDSEVIMHLYEAFGTECLNYLRGDFAFAIWDNKTNKLFLGRDRFGIRPLFYYHDKEGMLLFATELKALLKTGMVNREIDLEAIYHYLFFTFFHQPQTPLKNVKSLLPGHYMTYNLNNGELRAIQYWDVPYSPQRTEDEDFIIRECGQILDEAIDIRARGGASIGVSLSGGLDSSTLATKIAGFGYPVKTFTFGFKGEGENLNEFEFASIVAKKIGSDHTELTMSPNDILMDLPKMIWHFDTPSAGIILSYCLAKTAKKAGVNVTFRGDGSHSAFEAPVENKFLIIQKMSSFLNVLPHKAKQNLCRKIERHLTALEPHARNKKSDIAALIRLFSTYFQAITGRKNLDLLFSEIERKNLFIDSFWKTDQYFKETSDIILDIMNKIDMDNIQEQLVYEEYKRFPNQALMHISSVNGAFSIEARQPYFDHKLVEFAQTHIPMSLKTISDPNKYILRKITESILPTETLTRPQHGFAMPFGVWLKRELKPLVDEVFSEQSTKNRNIFNYKSIKRIYDQFYSTSRTYMSWRKIWSLVTLEMWFRLYCDPEDIQPPSFTGPEMIS